MLLRQYYTVLGNKYLFCKGEVLEQQGEELLFLFGEMLLERSVNFLNLAFQLP